MTGVKIGLDTGAMARDVLAGRATAGPLSTARGGNVLLHHTSGAGTPLSAFNGGPDEHTAIFIRGDGTYVWTWESCGSGNGTGPQKRNASFWQYRVTYPGFTDQARFQVLAWCAAQPHVPYCATPCRFCNCSACCYDCSGWASSAWWRGPQSTPIPPAPKGWLDMLTDDQQALLFNRIWEIHNVIFGTPNPAPHDHSLIQDIHNVAVNLDHGHATDNAGLQAQVKNALGK